MSQGPFPGVKVGGNAVPRPAISAIWRSQASKAGKIVFLTLRASYNVAAAQCIVIGPVCRFVCLWACVFVGLLPQYCVHRSSPNWVSR